MNTFPITNEKLVSEYDHVYKDHRIPVLDWGKKYYLIYNGSLHAIIPLFVALACKKGEFELGIKPWLGCKVAGEDKVKLFECGGCYGFDQPSGLKLFLTPEDYDRFCEDGKSGRHVPGYADVYQIIGQRCVSFEFEYGWCVPKMWWFSPSSHQPVLDRVRYKDVWIDEDGIHATIVAEGKDGRMHYLTKEECMAANKKPVVEFDEPEPEPDVIMDETNGHEAELVRRINDAWDKYREEFYPILCALYRRDIMEIYNSDAFAWQQDASPDWVLGEMQAQWDFYAPNYLQHIADNQDLSTILHFLNYGNR